MLKIPTDNLVKFVAISGLIIFSFGLYGLYYSFELNREINIAENQRILYWQKMDEMSRIDFDRALEAAKKREIIGYNLNKKNTINKTRYYEIMHETETDKIEFSYRRNKLLIFITSSIFLILIGLPLFVFGFRKWYLKDIALLSSNNNKNIIDNTDSE